MKDEKGKAGAFGERWLGIANLLLTVLIGAGIALFLNYREEQLKLALTDREEQLKLALETRDENLQRELVVLKAEADRQAALAHFEVTPACLYYTSCSGAINVRNTGPATAINVKVVISIDSISDAWRSSISNISDFTVKKFPASLDLTVQRKSVDVLYSFQEFKGNNAVEVSLGMLPPNTDFQVYLLVAPSISTTLHTITRPVTIYFQTPVTVTTQMRFSDKLRDFLDSRYAVARFKVTSNCDNCEKGRPSRDEFIVSSRQGWGFKTNSWKRATLQTGEEVEISDIEMYIQYEIPLGATTSETDSPLYLEVSKGYDPDEMYIHEIGSPLSLK